MSVSPVQHVPLPEGAHRTLIQELRDLHLRAGLPSVREIARKTEALSRDTVHRVLVGKSVPRWGPLELIVEALGGDVEVFRELWIAAHRQTEPGYGR